MKAPTNYKANSVGGTSMGNKTKGEMDKSVMSYPKNGLEAESRGNKTKGEVNTKIFSSIPKENTIGGSFKGN